MGSEEGSSVALPERVQALIDGASATAYCGHCRQPGAPLRCTRCRVSKYCSVGCQKAHFKLHKKNCKGIQQLRVKVEEGWAGPPPEVRGSQGSPQLDDYVERTLNYVTASETFQLGDMLLQVGYRESDTIEHGNLYYREALKCYLRPMPLLKHEYYSHFGWIDDRVLLLLVLLGGDADTLREWCHCDAITRRRKRGHHFGGARTKLWGLEDEQQGNAPDAPPFGICGYAVTDDLPFHRIMLLSELKSMAKYRQNPTGVSEGEVEDLKDRADKAIYSIRCHGNGYLLETSERISR